MMIIGDTCAVLLRLTLNTIEKNIHIHATDNSKCDTELVSMVSR